MLGGRILHFLRASTVAETHTEHGSPPDIWEHMTPEHQRELKQEDSVAWYQVVGVLLLIISMGLVLAIGTAAFSGRF